MTRDEISKKLEGVVNEEMGWSINASTQPLQMDLDKLSATLATHVQRMILEARLKERYLFTKDCYDCNAKFQYQMFVRENKKAMEKLKKQLESLSKEAK